MGTRREPSSAIDELVSPATDGEPDSQEVISLVTRAKSGDDETASSETIEGTGETANEAEHGAEPSPPKTRKRKADLERELDDLRREHDALKARHNDDAINGLSATIAVGIQVTGDFVAASRGSHWKFSSDETKPMGDAWAVVVAPYAEKLQKYLPLVIALGLTWKSLKPRLDIDREIADARNNADVTTES